MCVVLETGLWGPAKVKSGLRTLQNLAKDCGCALDGFAAQGCGCRQSWGEFMHRNVQCRRVVLSALLGKLRWSALDCRALRSGEPSLLLPLTAGCAVRNLGFVFASGVRGGSAELRSAVIDAFTQRFPPGPYVDRGVTKYHR